MVLGCLENSGAAPITTTYTGAGQVAWDDCCGTLVVTPERTYRSVTFPEEFTEEDRCDNGMWVIDVLVTLVRCTPVPDDQGNPPNAAEMQAANAAFLADSAAIFCCLMGDLPNDEWLKARVSQEIVGAEGGCISSETRFSLGTPWFEWCC